MLPARLLAFIAVISGAAGQQTLRFVPVPRETVMNRLEAVPEKVRDRAARVRAIFGQAGCGGGRLADVQVKHLRDPNIICTSPGETAGRIVIGAHYDASDAGGGVADNWTGAALLASLYQAISAEPRRHTFIFAAFAGEETGLVGSTAFVKGLSADERKAIGAMLNLDTLGLSSTKLWLSGSDARLSNAFAGIARVLKVPLAAVNVEKVGTSDSQPFREARIPVVSIHSVTQETLEFLHSPLDRLDAIRRDDYYETYRLVLGYLVFLDQNLGREQAGDGADARRP